MAISAKLRRAPMRIVTGAYILNSGVSKFSADDDTAKQMHGMASNTYGVFGGMDPKTFSRVLGAGETAIGALVLAPVVPPVVAGGALMGFSSLLLRMYWNTPGMHEEGSPRPTPQGSGVAKDVWMFGIGTGLVLDGVLEPAHNKRLQISATVTEKKSQKRKQARQARKAAKVAAKTAGRRPAAAGQDKQAKLSARARQAAEHARAAEALKRAQVASAVAAERLASMRDEYGPVAAEKARVAKERAKALADEYGPIAAEKAKQARAAAQDLAGEYGPIAAEKARQAQAAAREAAERLRAGVR